MSHESLHIVLVDDETDLLYIFKEVLSSSLNCKISTFSDASIALKFIQSEKVDFVFSDIRMPVMDGVHFLEKIKETNPDIPIVVMMSGHTKYSEEDLLNRGAALFLKKPVDPSVVIDYIKNHPHNKSK